MEVVILDCMITNHKRYEYYVDRKTYLDNTILDLIYEDPEVEIDYVLANSSHLFDMLLKYKQYEDISKGLPTDKVICTKRVLRVPQVLSSNTLDMNEPAVYLSGNIVVADVCYIHQDNFREMRKNSGSRYYLSHPLESMPSSNEVLYSSARYDPVNLSYLVLLRNTCSNNCIIDSRSFVSNDYEVIY